MTKKEKKGRPCLYKNSYPEIVASLTACGVVMTDKRLAAFFDVSVSAVQEWKKKFPDFQQAAKSGKLFYSKRAMFAAYQNLSVRKQHSTRQVINQNNEIVTLRDSREVLPTHSDIIVMKKLGMIKKAELQSERVAEIYQAKRSGKMTASYAIEELHLLNVPPPPNWLRQAEIEAEAEVLKEEPITKIEIVRISDKDGNFINHDEN